MGKVRWATAQGLVHLVEHVHELHRLGLHLTTDLVKLSDEVVVSEERHDTDDKTTDSGHERFVDTAREERYVDAALASVSHIKEGTYHTGDRTEEADHRSTGSDGSEDRKALLQTTDLDVTCILDDHEDV